MTKKSVHQEEDITILNVYMPNKRTTKYMNQKLIEQKGQIYKSKIIIRDFSTPGSTITRLTKHKISNDIEEHNNAIN